jgi:CubicO group peptidase (beta-lactamase class C family)
MDKRLMDAFLDGLIPRSAPCYSAAVVNMADGVVYERLAGNRQVEPEKEPICLDALFDLASLSKVVGVTTALLRTLDAGKISLDAPLSEFFSDSGNYATVTIRHLATHTAGFVPEMRLWDHVQSPSGALPFILHTSPLSAPGSAVVYSCFGFIVLGKVLEQVWKRPLDHVVAALVTKPLGMRHTWYNPRRHGETVFAATEKEEEDGRYHNGIVHDENARFLGGISGNAGLFSTLEDMETFAVKMLRNEDGFLSPSSLSLLVENQTEGVPGESRSVGWKVAAPELFGTKASGETVGHTGFTGTSLVLDYGSGKGALLLTNRVHPSRKNTNLLALRGKFADLAFS